MEINSRFFIPYLQKIENRQDMDAAHVREMIEKLLAFPPEKREKQMRWVGFIQGWFWAKGLFTVDEMKAHNR